MGLDYHDESILTDANSLLIHHVKRQTGIHKDDKYKIKLLLRHFLLDLFKHPRQDMSDDEKEEEDDDKDDQDNESDTNGKSGRGERGKKKRGAGKESSDEKSKDDSKKKDQVTEADVKIENKDGRRTPLHARDMASGESYSHMMCNNNWYLFLRLHNILCERLTK